METTREVKLPEALRKKLEDAEAVSPRYRPWEEWERFVVRKYGPKFGARGLQKFLPGRTAEAIQMQMARLGVRWVGK